MAPRWLTIVSKFGDHLPFYRQAGIFERQGLHLDRGTLGNWVGRACFHLMPVIEHMKVHLRTADRIFVALEARLRRDDTGAPPARRDPRAGAGPGPEGHQERPLLGCRRRR